MPIAFEADRFYQVNVTLELAFTLYLLDTPEEKSIKNVTNNLQKIRDKTYIPRSIESIFEPVQDNVV